MYDVNLVCTPSMSCHLLKTVSTHAPTTSDDYHMADGSQDSAQLLLTWRAQAKSERVQILKDSVVTFMDILAQYVESVLQTGYDCYHTKKATS